MANSWIPHSRPTIRKDELKNTLDCMVSDYIAPGNLAKEFENKLSQYLTMPFVQTLSSGTLSLFLILKLLNIKEGDEIILSSYSSRSLLNPIYYLKAVPVLVDCHLNDYSPIKEQISTKINDKTKALILTHHFGLPICFDQYKELQIPIIENASEALGGDYEGKKCGSMGDYSFFSFFANKMISTGGSGGAIALKNKSDYEKLSKLIENKCQTEFQLTYPFLLNDLQASMGISQMKHLDEFVAYRVKIAEFYSDKLKEAGKQTPPVFLDRKSVFYRYIIKTSMDLQDSIDLFKKYSIEAELPIASPLHKLLKMDNKHFPNAELLSRENISIPIYPTLKKSDAESISKIITKI